MSEGSEDLPDNVSMIGKSDHKLSIAHEIALKNIVQALRLLLGR
jgi:hypothetical protein